jgi:Leucine rich repeat
MSKEDIVPPRQLQSADFSRTNIFESTRSDIFDKDDLDDEADRLNESRPDLTFIGQEQPDDVYSQSNYSGVPSSGNMYTTETASQSYPSSVGTNSYYHNDHAQPNTYSTGATYEPEVAFSPPEPAAAPINNDHYAGGQYAPGIQPAQTELKPPPPPTTSSPPPASPDAMCCGCKRWIAIAISVVAVIVVIVIVVVAAATGSSNGDKAPATRDGSPISPVVRIPSTPTVLVPTPAAAIVPTPTTSTATSDLNTRPTEEAEPIIAYINEISFLRDALTYTTTPAIKEEFALMWLLDLDPLNLDLLSATSDNEAATKSRLAQRYALAALSVGSQNWLLAFNWLTANECTWYGITCDSTTGAVTEINLPTNNIQGGIPADLGLLTSMTSLSLSGNALTGTLPVSFGVLSNLQYLDVSSNSLEGTIPSSIGALGLITASFAFNLFTGTVPSTFCSNSALTLLADCANEVACSCCDVCA